jgi:Domain of unknown function (DUF5069)
MDLTKGVPRSPYQEMGGIVFLPRAIDKMRAHLAGTKGEYNSHHGTSGRMCRLLLGISADELERIVRENATDEGVLAALRRRAPVTAERRSGAGRGVGRWVILRLRRPRRSG